MTDDVKALIAEAREMASSSAIGHWERAMIDRLADALQAATVAPAVDREALIQVLDPSTVEGRHLGRSHAGLVLHERQATAIAQAIIASGLLRDVRDVQAEALEQAAGAMYGDAVVLGGVPGWLRARAQAIREARSER